jgi:hypothetical protein
MYRRQLNSEYIDILLEHRLRPPIWQQDYMPLQGAMSEAEARVLA